MHKIWHVAKNDIIATLSRKSFVLAALFIPLMMMFFVGLMISTDDDAPQVTNDAPAGEVSSAVEQVTEVADRYGYVDYTGLLTVAPDEEFAKNFLPFTDETAAVEALEQGDITGYFIIPQDFVEQGDLLYIDPDFNSALVDREARPMTWALFVNLSGGDPALADRAIRPMEIVPSPVHVEAAPQNQEEDCSRPGFDCRSIAFVRYMPDIIRFVLYMCIIMSATLMLNSVSEERKNRVIERLLVSISTREMLTGKILGLSIVSVMMFAVWGVMGFVALNLGWDMLRIPEGFQLPADFVLWFVVFLLLGFALYASLMAGAGALIDDVRKNSGASLLVIAPLFIQYIPLPEILDDVLNLGGALQNGLMTFYSFFPLTSPIAMVERIAAGPVALWEPILSAAILVVTTVLVIRGVAGMFRARILLSGQPFSVRRYFAALAGKA